MEVVRTEESSARSSLDGARGRVVSMAASPYWLAAMSSGRQPTSTSKSVESVTTKG